MSIYMIESRLWVPREAAGTILQFVNGWMCAGCPISVGGEPPGTVVKMGFYTNEVEITDDLVLADLTPSSMVETLNGEASPDYCLDHIEGPSLTVDGEWALLFDQAIFTYGGSGETVFGAMLFAFSGLGANQLIGVSKFEIPVPVVFNDVLKHSATLPLLPQIPLTE